MIRLSPDHPTAHLAAPLAALLLGCVSAASEARTIVMPDYTCSTPGETFVFEPVTGGYCAAQERTIALADRLRPAAPASALCAAGPDGGSICRPEAARHVPVLDASAASIAKDCFPIFSTSDGGDPFGVMPPAPDIPMAFLPPAPPPPPTPGTPRGSFGGLIPNPSGGGGGGGFTPFFGGGGGPESPGGNTPTNDTPRNPNGPPIVPEQPPGPPPPQPPIVPNEPPTPVPVPPALPLIGGAVAALGGVGIWRRKRPV